MKLTALRYLLTYSPSFPLRSCLRLALQFSGNIWYTAFFSIPVFVQGMCIPQVHAHVWRPRSTGAEGRTGFKWRVITASPVMLDVRRATRPVGRSRSGATLFLRVPDGRSTTQNAFTISMARGPELPVLLLRGQSDCVSANIRGERSAKFSPGRIAQFSRNAIRRTCGGRKTQTVGSGTTKRRTINALTSHSRTNGAE